MKKKNNKYVRALNAFFKGIKIFFIHSDKFSAYMTFPIMGQIAGIFLIFLITYLYAENLPYLTQKFPIFDNLLTAMVLLLLFTVPVFFLLCKAIYDYIIALAALNSIASNYMAKGRVKRTDTKVHNELIKRRAFNYILLVLLLGIIYIIGLIPFLWVPLLVFIVYSSLTFQVFALEENMTPINAVKRSFMLVKHNFWATTLLLVLLFLFTYMFLPNLAVWALDKGDIIYYLSNPVEKFVKLLPIDLINEYFKSFNLSYELEPYEISRNILIMVFSFIITAYTLPLRSCCCTIWYKELDNEKIEENSKTAKYDSKKVVKKVIKKQKPDDNDKES